VLTAGTLACWGNNANAELGTGPGNSQEYNAVIVPGLSVVTAVTASLHQTCAVVGGAVKCWGINGRGQVGNGQVGGNAGNVDSPTSVVGLSAGATAVSAGLEYACAVVSGAVKCWGNNGDGMLGDNSRDQRTSPVSVTGLSNDNIAVAASVHHTCSLSSTGAVKCWGSNVAGVLGNPSAALGVMARAPVGVVSLP